MAVCDICGKTVNDGETTNIGGKRYCSDCASDKFAKKVKAVESEKKIIQSKIEKAAPTEQTVSPEQNAPTEQTLRKYCSHHRMIDVLSMMSKVLVIVYIVLDLVGSIAIGVISGSTLAGIISFVVLVVISLLAVLMNFVLIEHLQNTVSINNNIRSLMEFLEKEKE